MRHEWSGRAKCAGTAVGKVCNVIETKCRVLHLEATVLVEYRVVMATLHNEFAQVATTDAVLAQAFRSTDFQNPNK